ncbi:MAG: hypothetical protein G01um101430_450 [Parcubacteria group bacterium Gr01-1014_30]|nr:MAG: hypothetical protein G01um101430_450 [Parcubacteria group bacterium Gr01-1014_30]
MDYSKGLKQLTRLAGWRQFFKILSRLEKVLFVVFTSLFSSSLIFLAVNFYFKNTEVLPAQGGTFREGVVGQPRFINPVYAAASDVDRDITELVFSGLLKYSAQGELVTDLTESYEIEQDGKAYRVRLKKDVFWSDGEPLTADDVIFTIETIQNSSYKSPLQVLWLGVDVEKVSELEILFLLRSPYGPFLENLTQKIIPKHVWQNIPPENFPLTVYNLNPVGSGSYKLRGLNQNRQGGITSLTLARNELYFGESPLLSQISFRFYVTQEDLLFGYKDGQIDGFALGNLPNFTNGQPEDLNKYSLTLPRYFAVFFNPEKSKILADQKVRQALNHGTDKDELVAKVLQNQGKTVDSPVMPGVYDLERPSVTYEFNLEAAKDLLKEAGFVEQEGGVLAKTITKNSSFQFTSDLQTGSQGSQVEEMQKCLAKNEEVYPEGEVTGYFGEKTKQAVIKFQEKYAEEILEPWGFESGTGLVAKTTRDKLNQLCFPQSAETQTLSFSLTTLNQPDLLEAAKVLKEQWAELGIQVEILAFDLVHLEKEVIKPRNYEALLFGQALGNTPDPFAFWHSSQTKDPGLNLTTFKSKEADKLLEENRQSEDLEARKEKLEKLQDIVLEAAPAVFLYSPDYLYFVSKEVKGIHTKLIPDPSKRFSGLESWHVKTKRLWKFAK